MKKIKNNLVIIFLAVVFFATSLFAVGFGQSGKGYALSPDYKEPDVYDTVYYFSDSSPAFREYAEGIAGRNFKVIFDVHYLISEQELSYMLYSGYFWGFTKYLNNTVIIELKTMRPDSMLLENLFYCLNAQGCKVMFISPYLDYYGSLSYCETSMLCNVDKYSLYLKQSLNAMMDKNIDEITDNTTLLLDGRFAGIFYEGGLCDLALLCSYSPALRRILCCMRYGCNDKGIDFEKELYKDIWSAYADCIENAMGYRLDCFSGSPNIDEFIDLWTCLQDMDIDFEEYFQNYHMKDYKSFYKEQVGLYYEKIVTYLAENNVHILVHADGDVYYDILNFEDFDIGQEVKEYHFSDYTEFTENFPYIWETEYFYAMGIWDLKQAFYDFLLDIQNQIKDNLDECVVKELPVYIWEENPVIWNDGLEIITDTMMREESGETEEYDQEELYYMFENLFIELLHTYKEVL